MQKPDVTFTVTVSRVQYIHACSERRGKEDMGFFGFHDSRRCPNCRYQDAGFEFWGENGHRQGSAPDVARMRHWVKVKAREQWRGRDGRLHGYRFRVNTEPIVYLGS